MGFGLLLSDYFYIGITLQSTPIYLLTMIASLIVSLRGEKIKNIYVMFFIIGAIACFVDFLTVPIISLGLPLMIYFLRIQKVKELSLKEIFKIVIFSSICWGIAYVAVWVTKWIIVDLVYNKGMIKTAIEQAKYRTIDEKKSFFETLDRNKLILVNNLKICFICGLLGLIINLIKYRKNGVRIKENIIKAVPYVLILLMPYTWYFVLREHAYYHFYFTYRNYFIVFIAVMLILIKIAEKERKE